MHPNTEPAGGWDPISGNMVELFVELMVIGIGWGWCWWWWEVLSLLCYGCYLYVVVRIQNQFSGFVPVGCRLKAIHPRHIT